MERRNCRQSISFSNQLDNMKSVLLSVALVIVAFGKTDALITCVCSDCSGDTCLGDICYSKVIAGIVPGSDPVYKQNCYFNAQAQNCNTSTDFHTMLCCSSYNQCNADLHPVLSSGDSSTSSADYFSSTDLFSSTEDGGNSYSEPSTDIVTMAVSSPAPPPPSPSTVGTCYVSDSSKGPEIRLCTLKNFCFSTLRRSNGTMVYRRGCSRSCEDETRNRKIKRCCTSSLCNERIRDPLEEIGSGTITTPLIQKMTTPPSSLSSTTRPSPSASPTTSTPPPLSTYSPPILDPGPSTPTSLPPTTSPTGINQPELICYCSNCGHAMICRTSGFCATLRSYQIPAPGSVPDPNPRSHLTITNFCITSAMGCEGELFMNPGESLECCNTSLCNTFQIPTTTLPEPEEPTAMTTTIVTETKAEAASTGGRQESTSDAAAHTSKTTPTPPLTASQRNYDLYFIIGIGILIVAGVILVTVVIVVICYCCVTRQRSSSRGKAKKVPALSCSSAVATTTGGISTAVANVEKAVGMKLSSPSPNIYAKQRARESVSVSTEGNTSNSGTGSSAPVPEGIPRTGYSSTSV